MSNPRRARLHVVGISHLDTQWRWTIRDTIERHLPATLRENFRRLEEFPSYVVAFDGSFRYRLIEELDPEGFARIGDWIRQGRWTIGGAFVDAADVNLPHPESLVRHALLAVRYFEDRFAVRPRDVFLPDCFGFGFALPSVAAHCGLVGFSSQKLSRGRIAGRLPFELGVWEGVDGSAVLAALDPGGYGEMLRSDLSHDTAPLYERERSGVGVAMRYFGVGDTGGAPGAETLAWLERSRAGAGPVEVRVGASGRLFEELSDEEVEALPRHRGELLMRLHGPGCYSAKAVMKRWNRLNERRARSAEIAACGAAALGLANYPQRKLNQAWERFLWHQFHDDLTGTSVPAAYDYSISDERLSYADFTDILAVGLRALGSALDTTMGGVPVVVWNASSRERAEIVEAEIALDHDSAAPLVALNAEGQATFCQVLARQGRRARIAFPARLRGLSVEVFEILEGLPDREPPEGETTSRRLARPGIAVELDTTGRLASIRTEFLGECLADPVELELLRDRSKRFPAWEIRHEDLSGPPVERFDGTPRVTVVAPGPWLQRIRVERELGASQFVDDIELAQGFPGVRVRSRVDWRTTGRLLKLAVRARVEDPRAVYGLGWGAIERPINTQDQYEVPAQQWADIGAGDGSRGLAILEDSKHGWDRPAPGTLRMTWIHSPEVGRRFRHQARQDFGRHQLRWALVPHADDWRTADIPALSERFENPPLAWVEPHHAGSLGRRHVVARVSGDGVALGALKMAEDGPEIVVRLRETTGRSSEARLTFPESIGVIQSVRPINGVEEPLGGPTGNGAGGLREQPALPQLLEHGFSASLAGYSPRAFAIQRRSPPLPPDQGAPLPLDFDLLVTQARGAEGRGFDLRGTAFPEEAFPQGRFEDGGLAFEFARRGGLNALRADGQCLELPAGTRRVAVLCAALRRLDAVGIWRGEGLVEPMRWVVPHWRWRGGRDARREDPPIAWNCRHLRRLGRDLAYRFGCLHRIEFEAPPEATTLWLPRERRLAIVAVTASRTPQASLDAFSALYDADPCPD